jgi:hypothetical protein
MGVFVFVFIAFAISISTLTVADSIPWRCDPRSSETGLPACTVWAQLQLLVPNLTATGAVIIGASPQASVSLAGIGKSVAKLAMLVGAKAPGLSADSFRQLH